MTNNSEAFRIKPEYTAWKNQTHDAFHTLIRIVVLSPQYLPSCSSTCMIKMNLLTLNLHLLLIKLIYYTVYFSTVALWFLRFSPVL